MMPYDWDAYFKAHGEANLAEIDELIAEVNSAYTEFAKLEVEEHFSTRPAADWSGLAHWLPLGRGQA